MQVNSKLTNQTWGKKGKKQKSGPIFGPFDPNLEPLNFFVSFTSTYS